MNNPAATMRGLRTAIAAAAAAATLLACSSNPQKTHNADEAATYNVQLGLAYLQRGDLAVAKEKLERAVKENPRDANVHGGLALLYDRLGKPQMADDQFRIALRLAPQDPDISNNYAVYLCKSHREAEGVRRFLAAAANPLYRTPAAAYINAGVCQRAAHDDIDAEKNFRRALQLRPNDAEATYQLANLEFQSGRPMDARKRIATFLGAFNPTADLLLLGVRVADALHDQLTAQRYSQKLRVDFSQTPQTRALAELNHTAD